MYLRVCEKWVSSAETFLLSLFENISIVLTLPYDFNNLHYNFKYIWIFYFSGISLFERLTTNPTYSSLRILNHACLRNKTHFLRMHSRHLVIDRSSLFNNGNKNMENFLLFKLIFDKKNCILVTCTVSGDDCIIVQINFRLLFYHH